ncbi:MAG TPA: O-antigen ligase family protein [Bryobacteraceae bacterium]|nr:O-antigen ligase family protein [Bryobacteraceae bacterium]
MAILLTALVFLLPLLITPGLQFHYDVTPKVIVLWLGVAGCAIFPQQMSQAIASLWSRPAGRWLCWLAAAQIACYALASAFSTRPWFSLLGSNWRRMGLVTVAALCLFTVLAAGEAARRPEFILKMLRATTVAVMLASVYGILQYFDIDALQAAAAYHAEAGNSTIVRPPGTLGHADYFGWWLAMGMFFALAVARRQTGLWRWLGSVACVLAGTAIVLSGTRSAILAVAAGFASLAWFASFHPRRSHWIAGLAAAAIFVAFYISPAGLRLRARVRWSSDEPVGGARPLLWRDALRMTAARPWIGFGPETFAAEFPRYQSVELAQLLPDFYHESPHNVALDALTSEGIPGLLIAAAWVFVGGSAAWKARAGTGPFIAAALVASCVAGMFGAATVGPMFFTLLAVGMLVALTAEGKPARMPALRAGVPRGAVALIAAGFAVFAILLAAADFQLARFQHTSGDPATAVELYAAVARGALPGAGEDLYCSRKLATLCGTTRDAAVQTSCVKAATQAAARATETADNPPNAWYNFAMFSAEQNDASKVEAALRAARALAPNWFKPHWSLASLLEITGRHADAIAEAKRANLLDAGKDREVRRTVARLTQIQR